MQVITNSTTIFSGTLDVKPTADGLSIDLTYPNVTTRISTVDYNSMVTGRQSQIQAMQDLQNDVNAQQAVIATDQADLNVLTANGSITVDPISGIATKVGP